MSWAPAAIDEVLEGIKAEISSRDPETWARFAGYLLDPYPSHVERSGAMEPVWIVARVGERVIYYDDVEDEFAAATERAGRLLDCILYGDLLFALIGAEEGRDGLSPVPVPIF